MIEIAIKKEQQYVIETQFGPVQLLAPDDLTAVVRARQWLTRCGFRGYNLFRYPLYWVDRPSSGLILIPLFNFVKEAA